MGAWIDASIVRARGVISRSSLPWAPPTPQPRQSDRTHHTFNRHDHQRARFRPHECETATPLLEAIERRATRLEVPVDSRIERGRTSLPALAQLIERAL